MKEPLLTEAAISLTCSGALLTLQVPQAYLLGASLRRDFQQPSKDDGLLETTVLQAYTGLSWAFLVFVPSAVPGPYK